MRYKWLGVEERNLGLEGFQQFFEEIVELCIEAGLVWGEELYIDSTKVQANASINGMIERAEYEVQKHPDQLFEPRYDFFQIIIPTSKYLSLRCKHKD